MGNFAFFSKKVDRVNFSYIIPRLFWVLYMANDESLEVEGVVLELLPGSQFLVKLSTEGFEGHLVKARVSGKMRVYFIKIVPGDSVKLVLSPYNLEEGRITYRYK